jgi:hypothetical protein
VARFSAISLSAQAPRSIFSFLTCSFEIPLRYPGSDRAQDIFLNRLRSIGQTGIVIDIGRYL